MRNHHTTSFSKITRLIAGIIFAIAQPFSAFAQQDIEMADVMRSNGKIFVVVAVVSIILLGIIIYLMMIDRRMRKIERENGSR